MFLCTSRSDERLGEHNGRGHIGNAIYGKIEQVQSIVDPYI